MNLNIERLRKLPRHADEAWQAALVQVPAWTDDGSGNPVRPWTALCVSTRTGLLGTADLEPSAAPSPRLVLDSLGALAFGKFGGYRPGRLEVNQPEVADDLRPLLAQIGIEIVEQDMLPMVDEAIRHISSQFIDEENESSAMSVKGVTIEHLRSFAEAARDFHQSAPWRQLTDEDLIEVVSPRAEPGLGFVAVMGYGGITTGLGFFETRKQYEQMYEVADPRKLFAGRGVWSLTFGPIAELPLNDADLWEKHQLPVADTFAYPVLMCFGPGKKLRRPTPAQWAFVEGLLRALTGLADNQIDSGRWSKRAATIDGPAEYVLELPGLLEAVNEQPAVIRGSASDGRSMERLLVDIERLTEGMEFSSPKEYERYLNENFGNKPVPHIEGRTPLERAEDLAFAAMDARGRRQLQMLRQALEICPDCAVAYVQLAERESNLDQAYELYRQGVAAGRRALGPKMFEDDAGHFWGIIETRPFMRALHGLAQTSEALDELDEAIEHYQELLRLNPTDNQGVRYMLAACLVRTRQFDKLEYLLVRYDEASAHWCYLRALAAFAMIGDTEESRRFLADGHQANPHVPKFLLGDTPMPQYLPATYAPGNADEGVVIAAETLDTWDEIEGALDWLRQNTRKMQGRGDRWKGIKRKSKKQKRKK